MTTTPTTPPFVGSTVWSSENPTFSARVVFDHAIILEADEILVRFPNTGMFNILRFTGRTRRFFNERVNAFTLDRFEVDTVVRNGVIMGVRGSKISGGTWAIRPDSFDRSVA